MKLKTIMRYSVLLVGALFVPLMVAAQPTGNLLGGAVRSSLNPRSSFAAQQRTSAGSTTRTALDSSFDRSQLGFGFGGFNLNAGFSFVSGGGFGSVGGMLGGAAGALGNAGNFLSSNGSPIFGGLVAGASSALGMGAGFADGTQGLINTGAGFINGGMSAIDNGIGAAGNGVSGMLNQALGGTQSGKF